MKLNKKEKILLRRIQKIRRKTIFMIYFAGCFAGVGLVLALLGLGLNSQFYTPSCISFLGYIAMLVLITKDGNKIKRIKRKLGDIL